MSILNWRRKKAAAHEKIELRLEQSQEQTPKPDRHYLSPAVGPVVPGLEAFEHKLAGAGHVTVRGIVSESPFRVTLTRWALGSEARAAIAAGADVYVELLTFGRGVQPMKVSIAEDLDSEEISAEYGFTPEKTNPHES